MRFTYILLVLLSVYLSPSASGQTNPVFRDFPLGQELKVVDSTLAASGIVVRRYSPPAVSFPLAEDSETHLLATDVPVGADTLRQVVFTFADNRLVSIQARGGITELLIAQPDLDYDAYEDYRFYQEASLVVQTKQDQAWKLTPGGMHLNLFTWDHPLLDPAFGNWPDYEKSVKIPEAIRMGESLEDLEAGLRRASRFIYRQELDGSDPNAQLQLDCFGVVYAGFPRKVEARFGDGNLSTVWILTGKAEEERLRDLLTREFGQPIFVSDDWEAFRDWQVFLRKDKPEILLLTPELGLYYRDNYFREPKDGQ